MIKNRLTFLLSSILTWSTLIGLILISGHVLAGEEELQARLSKLERMVDNRGLVDILNEVESLQREVRELRGEIEQQAYIIDQMKKRQQNLYDDLDQRLQTRQGRLSDPVTKMVEDPQQDQPNIEPVAVDYDQPDLSNDLPVAVDNADLNVETPAIESPVPVPTTNKPSTSSSIKPVETYVAQQENNSSSVEDSSPSVNAPEQAPEIAPDSNEENSYSEAFTLLKQGQHKDAVENFRTFLQQYPSSQYADNAQYWLGESFYTRRKFEMAITEYKTLLSQYPDSGKASHAQLKIGYCYDELGQADFAQGELEDLIARYPGTSAASLAEERLAQIRSQ